MSLSHTKPDLKLFLTVLKLIRAYSAWRTYRSKDQTPILVAATIPASFNGFFIFKSNESVRIVPDVEPVWSITWLWPWNIRKQKISVGNILRQFLFINKKVYPFSADRWKKKVLVAWIGTWDYNKNTVIINWLQLKQKRCVNVIWCTTPWIRQREPCSRWFSRVRLQSGLLKVCCQTRWKCL